VVADARELYDKMLKIYPDRVNPGTLWTSARGVKPQLGILPTVAIHWIVSGTVIARCSWCLHL
jgi:hypothetical protein